ncbi:tyrosine-type recombinase/integrase [Streptomyces sp. NPDC002476]|uniref:tyrosine-type recombinase/integrase n=1 Tax=Streptomyces sp. NPDC002476 TaxID=3364648 RepID=UPI003690EA76
MSSNPACGRLTYYSVSVQRWSTLLPSVTVDQLPPKGKGTTRGAANIGVSAAQWLEREARSWPLDWYVVSAPHHDPVPSMAAGAADRLASRDAESAWLFCTASGGKLDEPAVWRTLQSIAERAGLPRRGPHGTKVDAITHALAKPDARPDKVQRWADHRDSRTTQRYNKRKELLDDSPGYGLAADVAGALAQRTD